MASKRQAGPSGLDIDPVVERDEKENRAKRLKFDKDGKEVKVISQEPPSLPPLPFGLFAPAQGFERPPEEPISDIVTRSLFYLDTRQSDIFIRNAKDLVCSWDETVFDRLRDYDSDSVDDLLLHLCQFVFAAPAHCSYVPPNPVEVPNTLSSKIRKILDLVVFRFAMTEKRVSNSTFNRRVCAAVEWRSLYGNMKVSTHFHQYSPAPYLVPMSSLLPSPHPSSVAEFFLHRLEAKKCTDYVRTLLAAPDGIFDRIPREKRRTMSMIECVILSIITRDPESKHSLVSTYGDVIAALVAKGYPVSETTFARLYGEFFNPAALPSKCLSLMKNVADDRYLGDQTLPCLSLTAVAQRRWVFTHGLLHGARFVGTMSPPINLLLLRDFGVDVPLAPLLQIGSCCDADDSLIATEWLERQRDRAEFFLDLTASALEMVTTSKDIGGIILEYVCGKSATMLERLAAENPQFPEVKAGMYQRETDPKCRELRRLKYGEVEFLVVQLLEQYYCTLPVTPGSAYYFHFDLFKRSTAYKKAVEQESSSRNRSRWFL